MQKTVLNILTGRWINPNEDIETMYISEFALDPLVDFYYSALIPPLSVLTIRADIREKFIISVESAVIRE
ncbi:13001_t:CDS:2, partial [Funneliformis mosseae]